MDVQWRQALTIDRVLLCCPLAVATSVAAVDVDAEYEALLAELATEEESGAAAAASAAEGGSPMPRITYPANVTVSQPASSSPAAAAVARKVVQA